jgi:multidrug efflux pump subunit AcrA (membrane-fusion protein)
MQNTFRGSEFAAIQQGDQLFPGQMFMQIVNPSSMVVNSSVNQVDVEHMRIGLKAKVRFDAYPGLELPAHIYSIAAITKPGGARASFVKEVPIRLKLDQMDPRVIPDLTVSAEVILESEAQATIAPAGAVFRDGPGKPSYVYVQTEAGWDRREVQVGMANNISVSIRSGVKPGDVVAMEVPPVENKTGQNMQPERDVWLDPTPRKNRAA